MVGGLRLLVSLISLLFPMAVVHASDSSTSTTALPVPPKAAVNPVAETIHGTRIVDDYRWLEDASSPETQRWVSEEGAYSRSLLDPLPGREQLHKRLGELLSIGAPVRIHDALHARAEAVHFLGFEQPRIDAASPFGFQVLKIDAGGFQRVGQRFDHRVIDEIAGRKTLDGFGHAFDSFAQRINRVFERADPLKDVLIHKWDSRVEWRRA